MYIGDSQPLEVDVISFSFISYLLFWYFVAIRSVSYSTASPEMAVRIMYHMKQGAYAPLFILGLK